MKEFRCMLFYDYEFVETYEFDTQKELNSFKEGFEVGQEYNLHTSMYQFSDLEKIQDIVFDEKFESYGGRYQTELREVLIELQKWSKE